MFASLEQAGSWAGASRLRGYGLAVATTLVATAIRVALNPELNTRPVFSIFAFAVLVTAVFGGTGPAILATVLSVIADDGFIFIFRINGPRTFALRDLVEVLLFVTIAAGMIVLNHIVLRARRRAEGALARQRELSDQLRGEEATQRAILANIPDAMVVIDENAIIQSFSTAAEKLFGYTVDEVRGRNVNLLMPQPYRGEHDGYVERYRRTGEARIIGRGRTVTGMKKDGTTFPMDLAIGEASVGGARTFVGFVRDLTGKIEDEHRMQVLQTELLHVSRLTAMGEMAAALAHELNQPLTAIANYAKAARRTLSLGADKIEDAQGMMDKVAGQSLRAGQIIRRLREFVEHREVTRAVENPVKVVEEAMALGLADMVDSNVTVHRHFDAAAPAVYIDKVQIQQVLVNLLRNSIEAMQSVERRELDIGVAAADGGVHISVCDSGPGLAEEVAARLFQPFVTTKKTGMGVGLSICLSIMEAHAGKIWVSPNPTGGVTFHLNLPAADQHHTSDETATVPA